MFCVVSRYVKSSLTVVVVELKSLVVLRVFVLSVWNLLSIAVLEFVAVLGNCHSLLY